MLIYKNLLEIIFNLNGYVRQYGTEKHANKYF